MDRSISHAAESVSITHATRISFFAAQASKRKIQAPSHVLTCHASFKAQAQSAGTCTEEHMYLKAIKAHYKFSRACEKQLLAITFPTVWFRHSRSSAVL